MATGVAVVHLGAVAFLVSGGLLAWRRPRLLWLHVPMSLTILAVNLAGADCPLTDLELALLGDRAYSGGFLGHYLVEPVYPAGITPQVETLIYAAAALPNVVAYSVLLHRLGRLRLGLTGSAS